MPDPMLLFNITPMPLLSVLVWIVLCVAAMYLARRPFHGAMVSLGRATHHVFRMMAAATKLAEGRLSMRNRQVLLASGRTATEHRIDREFLRIGKAVEHGLANYPQLQRQIREHLLVLEKDYQRSADIPQRLSDWVRVIDAIAAIQPPGDPMVASILETIHTTLENQHRTALDDYRKSMSRRHTILSRMAPRLQATGKALDRIESAIQGLTERSRLVDQAMADYETIRSSPEKLHGRLFASALPRFIGATLALGVFSVGAVLNFNLVALPMTEMVGGNSFIGNFRTADVAGGFLVSMVLMVGMFLMDALRFTRFFPAIGTLDHRRRAWLLGSLVITLMILAGMESSLAFMRDRMIADAEALRQSLSGIDPPIMAANRIATIGQMILGFILPVILATAAIPLETFLSTLRTIAGAAVAWGLRSLVVLLRLSGHLAGSLPRLINTLYDLAIFPALWVESIVMRRFSADRIAEVEIPRSSVPAHGSINISSERASCRKNSDA